MRCLAGCFKISDLWRDESGFIVSAELVLIATILVLGLIVGLTCVQGAVVREFQDLAFAFDSLDQSFAFSGLRGCIIAHCPFRAFTAGSFFFDRRRLVAFDCDIVGGGFGVGAFPGGGIVGPGAGFVGPGVGAVGPALIPPPVLTPGNPVCPDEVCPPFDGGIPHLDPFGPVPEFSPIPDGAPLVPPPPAPTIDPLSAAMSPIEPGPDLGTLSVAGSVPMICA